MSVQTRYDSIFSLITTMSAMSPENQRMTMAVVIRAAWMASFLLGAAAFAWLEWRSGEPSSMVWFLLTGLWSAVCGVGYTLMHWMMVERTARRFRVP